MFDRELTQLISIAKYYLDAAEALDVPVEKLASTVTADSALWRADRQPHLLSALDTFSAHLASCAARLATIHEILVGGTKQAWAAAYPNDHNVTSATEQALEILLRDNVAHDEEPATSRKRADFRQTALAPLTFQEMHDRLKTRYQHLAAEMLKNQTP